MARALDRMLWRDLIALRMQSITIALVIAAGTAAFVATMSTHASLTRARDAYYAESRFAELFVRLRQAPIAVSESIAALPGVAAILTGQTHAARIALDGVEDLLSARLINLPDHQEVNALTLRAGRWPDPGSAQILLGEAFASRRGLRPGDTLHAVINGRDQALTIAGIAASPEFLIGVSEGGMADDRTFAIIWMDGERLAAAFGARASFNTLAVKLAPDGSVRALKAELDHLLERYGSRGAFDRSEQPSHRVLTQEINEQRVFATVLPTIFLAVAVFILHVVLSRVVGTQRDRIATLKALGYPSLRIAGHYLLLAALVALAGNVVGVVAGKALGAWMTGLFINIFRIPDSSHRIETWIAVLPAMVSSAGALGAAALAVREVLKLSAAEAMQPPAPPAYRHRAARPDEARSRVAPATLMIARSVMRRPVRATLTMLGMSGAIAILVAGSWWRDAFEHMIGLHFGVAMPADLHLGITRAVPDRVVYEISRLPGVLQAETRRAVAVRIGHGTRAERVALETLADQPRLRQPIDARGQPVAPPVAGLMLGNRLAQTLGVQPGDRVQVEFLEGRQRIRDIPVGTVYDEPMGRSAFIAERELRVATGDGPQTSLIALRIARDQQAELIAALKKLPAVTGVFDKHALIAHIRANTERNLLVFTGVLSVFAAAIAAGVVYNSARIALAERRWELATLRVLGMTQPEVSRLLLGELALQTLLAIPVGCVAGRLLAALLVEMMSAETFTIPVTILPRTYVWAIGVMLLTGLASAFAVHRRLSRLDLIAVLKTRE